MKKLNRGLSTPPTLLENYSYLTNSWDDITSRKKRKIWQEIKKFQEDFCVYCELPASYGNGHIEHFFHKGENDDGAKPFIHLTFEWNNLFGCCASSTHCGHYKDQKLVGGLHRKYDPNKLLKPDDLDPQNFFVFTPSGDIIPNEEINDNDKEIAEETIKALNLKEPSLQSSRRSQINACTEILLELNSIEGIISENQFNTEYTKIMNEFSIQKHRTAVKQTCFI